MGLFIKIIIVYYHTGRKGRKENRCHEIEFSSFSAHISQLSAGNACNILYSGKGRWFDSPC